MVLDQEKLVNDLRKAFETYEAAALVHIEPLVQMLQDNPDKGINLIFKTYNRALNDAYTGDDGKNMRGFVEAMAGGPYEGIPSALYDAVGTVYPYLERPQKNKALRQVLNCMDSLNYRYVQISHTPYVREPLLFSDIETVRWMYWPGLHDEEHLWKGKPFYQVREEIIDENGMFRKNMVNSDYLVAYALLRTSTTGFGEDYVSVANPNFLDRVLKGIVAMRFAHSEDDADVEKGKSRLRELLPACVHSRLEEIRLERDWVDYTLPEFR